MSEHQSSCASTSEKSDAVEYRDVPGYEGLYQVSANGNVRSIDRVLLKADGTSQFFRGRMLKPSIHKDGYHCVNLQRCGNIKGHLVHRLVYIAFIGMPSQNLQLNHKDGVKANNALSNLEAVTASENCRHRDATGLRQPARGSKSGMAKLDESQVAAIASLIGKIRKEDIAKQFGVSTSTIYLIAQGKVWSHCTGIERKESRLCTS